jgi:hypothetical protein
MILGEKQTSRFDGVISATSLLWNLIGFAPYILKVRVQFSWLNVELVSATGFLRRQPFHSIRAGALTVRFGTYRRLALLWRSPVYSEFQMTSF